MENKKQEIDKNKFNAFFHLIYEYRCLANAAYAWNKFGDPSSENKEKENDSKLIPEVSTIIQDSLLLHARALIEFFYPDNYSKRETDINITRFIALNSSCENDLINLKRAIEVHVLHMTDWRDPSIREQSSRVDIQRKEWDKENKEIFDRLIRLLEDLSNRLTFPWNEALKSLKNASEERFKKGACFNWPKNLGEKENVKKYLQNLITNLIKK